MTPPIGYTHSLWGLLFLIIIDYASLTLAVLVLDQSEVEPSSAISQMSL